MKFWDFLKANFGICILVLLFAGMVTLAVCIATHPNWTSASDFLTWTQGKVGEILASIMTIIVGGATGHGRRAGDRDGDTNPRTGGGNGADDRTAK